jgi:hypothetical protein
MTLGSPHVAVETEALYKCLISAPEFIPIDYLLIIGDFPQNVAATCDEKTVIRSTSDSGKPGKCGTAPKLFSVTEYLLLTFPHCSHSALLSTPLVIGRNAGHINTIPALQFVPD